MGLSIVQEKLHFERRPQKLYRRTRLKNVRRKEHGGVVKPLGCVLLT